MNITRKQFLLLTASACAGCNTPEQPGAASAPSSPTRKVDAGPVSAYAADGVYDRFRFAGFYIVRKGASLQAISSYCTHRKCKLTAEPDRSFYCDCHGSTFDPAGKVTHGPATKNLPVFPADVNSGRLIVTVAG